MDAADRDHYVEALRKAAAQIKALIADKAALETDKTAHAERRIAVVGMGCRFPGGGNDPERFWDLLARGGDAVGAIPPDRFDTNAWWHPDPDAPGKMYVRDAALIGDVRGFDPAFFRITPAEAESLDPQQRLLLEVSWEAFEDAGIDVRRIAGSRAGVFVGLSNYDYIQAHVHSGDPARITPYSGSGVMFSTAAGRLSYFYDLQGPCVTLDTACSSSLVALHAAIGALRARECDMAVAGGVSLILSPDSNVALCKVRALAADGRSRAFDDDATGYGRGEGCGLVVLKRLDDALRDGDVVHAVLAGSAVNHDGRSNGLTAPNGPAQQTVIRAALADAGLLPADMDYIEAHGTGTPLGDPIEFGALDRVFGRRTHDLLLGSVKTNIGHAEAAAGIAGLIKVVLALRHETLPASLHFDTPNHHIDWDAASISVVGEATPWPDRARPRAAGISSFGLSGTNAHLIVTAPPAAGTARRAADLPHVLPISAATQSALAEAKAGWARALDAGDPGALAAIAARRTPLAERFVAIGETAAELAAALRLPTAQRIAGTLADDAARDAVLWCAGGEVDWAARGGRPHTHVAAPHYPFRRKDYWLDIAPVRPAGWSPARGEETSLGQPMRENGTNEQQRIVDHLVTMLAAITGFDPAEIDPAQHLTDMGLDSLMLLKLGQAVESRYGVELKMSQLFRELGTLADIERYLDVHATSAPVAAAPQSAHPTVPAPVTPAAPAVPGDASLFQQQLRAMTDLAAQNLASLTALTRLQLGAESTPTPPASQPAIETARPPRPPAPTAVPAAAVPAAVPVAAIRGINLAGAQLSSRQRAFVGDLVARHVARTRGSKTATRDSRGVLADWKHTLSFWGQLKEAKYPIVSAGSKGARVTDIDGNVYIDVAMGMGVHFFGHAPDFIHDALKAQLDAGIELGTQTPFTARAAALLTDLTGTERVAFSNTGSEVVMIALRLARAATGRSTVVLFKNSYHGIFDGVLATEQDGATVPIGLGTPAGMIEDLVVLPYDSPASLEYVRAHGDSIAAVLVEPVQSRDPDLQPQGFLKALRRATAASGTALIFDEMINGFRIAPGGARAWFGVDADMALYGKIVGGGMPIGVIAGKARFLDYIDGGAWDYGDRSGPQSAMIYFGGTFCRNPATMVAAHAALAHMKAQGPALQERVTARTTAFCDRLNRWFEVQRVPLRCRHFSSQWRIVPVGAQDREPIELELLYLSMLVRGVYTWERRISFFSTEHGEADIAAVFDAITGAVEDIRAGGFDWSIDSYPDPQFTPLSSPERRMYALAQRDGGELPYHLPQAFLIEGPLDIDRMEEAFRTVVTRHEGLRTAFATIDGEALAKRSAEPRFAIERENIAEDEIEACTRRFVRPFDLAQAPLLRVGVATIAPGHHLLLADAHHIAVDGLSFDIVAAELMAAYEGKSLAPIDYDARAARRSVDAGGAGERGEANAAFWCDQLADLPVLALPTDRSRAPERDFRGDTVIEHVAVDQVARLKTLARAGGTSLFIVLLAAWSGFLHRLTGQDDIAIAGASSGREDAAVAKAVGMFVNTILFRTRPDADLPFAEHLAAVAGTALAAYDHGDYPFEALAALAPPPEPGRNTLFDTMLSYENASARAFRIEDLTFTAHDVTLDAAMFDLALEVTELDGALTLRFAFATALLDRATIVHWAADFVRMLAVLPDDPDRPLGRIDIGSEGERALIAAFNDTAAAYPETTLAGLFAESAARHGVRTAVVFEREALSYAELDRQASALAAAIAERAPAGSCVGMLLPRSARCVVAELAILKAACVFVPLDPRHPSALLDHILRDSKCAAVLTDAATAALLPEAHRELALDILATGAVAVERSSQPDDIAYVIYTSGSTGLPKGCLVTHRNAVRLLANDAMPIAFGCDDVGLCAHSFAFDFSIWEVWCALAYGGSVVIAGGDTVRDPAALLALLRAHRVTVLNQTPAAFYGLIEAERAAAVHDLDRHLRAVIFGGDRLDCAYLRLWAGMYPPGGTALVNMYGITETTVHVSWHRIVETDLTGGRSPIGRPLPATTIEVRGPQGLPQPIGVPGELWVGGGGVCRGYLDRPDLTATRFVDGYYRTGDIGRLRADGVLDYIGRNDAQVQVRGHRIELAGIEHWLAAHPQVARAVVAPRDDRDGRTDLVAYVVAPADVDPDALRDHLAAHLPGYAIPGRFVALAELPMTANGKLDRAALPAPDAVAAPAMVIDAPRNATETTIAAVWADVLRVPAVGVRQNYFTLGGDSIKALQIVSRLHQAGIATSIAQLLNAKTVAALAALLDPHTAAAAIMPAGDSAPLTAIQHWFVETHGSAAQFNNAALLAAERIDHDALELAFNAVVAHHEGLRQTLDPSAVLRIAPTVVVPVERVDIPNAAALTAHAGAAQASFDLAHPPLLRVIRYRLADGDRLLVLCHHLVVDGVSWRILIEDLLCGYAAVRSGLPIALPPAGRWSDWARAQAVAATDPALRDEIGYWQHVESADIPPLPVDFDDDVNAVADALGVEIALDRTATARLVDVASADESGMPAQLLGAVAFAARAVFGRDRLRVRLEGHGREDIAPGLDPGRTIGWFTSLFPAVVEIGDAADLPAAAARVGAMLGRIPRKGVGYGLLRYLTPPDLRTDLHFGPAPELGFNYLGHFDDDLGGGFRLADEPTGPLVAPTLRRPELIDIEAAIVGGRLRIAIGYGARLHARATIERFAAALQDALCPSAIEATLALSPLQAGMYFHALSGDGTSYVQQFTYRIAGPLDPAAYAVAWQQLVARHQALRATIVAAPGEAPRQAILKDRPIPIHVEDLRRLADDERAAVAVALAETARAGFNLADDPLVRIALLRMAEEETDVVLTLHHIISDGWSLGVMMEELATLYRAQVEGRAPELPPAPLFARHLDWLAAQDEEVARRFWAVRLQDAPPPSTIPGTRPAGDRPYDMAENSFAFDGATTQQLTELAAALEVTLNTIVQSLWATLLAGFNGRDDVMFGAIAAGRPAGLPGVERMVGLFLQPIPIRVRLSNDSIATLAKRIQDEANEAEPYHYFPLAEMQRLDGKRRTLFDHVLVFENYPFADVSDDMLTIGDVRAIEQMHFDFSLVVQPGERLEIKFTYNRNAVDMTEFERIEAQWRALTAAVLADKDRALGEIDLGTAAAPEASAAAITGTVLDLFDAQVAAWPEAIAVERSGESISYQQLDARAEALAGALHRVGVAHGDRVASFLPSGIDHIATMLAVWKLCAIFVPLDADAPVRRIALLGELVAPAAWVTSADLRDRLVAATEAPKERLIVWHARGVLEDVADSAASSTRATADSAAYVMFTSGSTGTPKPILASHGGLRHFIDWEIAALGIAPGARVSNLALPTFDVSLRDIFLPLATGGTACIPPADTRRDGTALAAWMDTQRIEIAHVVPSIFRLVLKAIEDSPRTLPRLRHLLFAGEMLWGADVERTRTALGEHVALRNLYGPSETTLAKFCHLIAGPVAVARAVPVGAPLPDTRLMIVKNCRPVAPGAIGEIHIAPPFVPLGYLGDTALTDAQFAERPEWGGGLFYRTGDLGRVLANGTLELCGRLDGQVKVSGVRIELGEIEQAAMASDEIEAAVAVAHKREDGELAIACYFTTKRPIDSATLRARLTLDLPAGIMPHFLVPLDAMPLGVNGKVDRRALPKPEELIAGRIAYVAPEGPVETRIAAIWIQVLGIRRIGACTSFFEVGGDSLRAIRVLTRANAEFDVALTIGAFFAAPTVRAMAAAMRPAEAMLVSGDHPASHAERRLWTLAQMGGNPAAYILSAAYEMTGALDGEALVDAIEALPARHEALRTVFVETDRGVRQRVLTEVDFRVTRLDLTDRAEREAAAAELARSNGASGFDLATGPLLSASLLRLAPDRHVLLFAVHHIVSDAESVTILVEDILRGARGDALPPLRRQLKDYAAGEAAWLDTPMAADARAWWHAQLRDLPERLDLPFDRLPTALPRYDGDRVSVTLDAATVASLRTIAQRTGATLLAGLTALTAALLQRHADCDTLILGMPATTRDDPALEEQIGCYVNLLPLRIDLAGDDDAATLIRRVATTIAAAIDRRLYPFDRLVEELGLAQDDGRPPLFDVAIVYQDAGQRQFCFDGVEVTAFGGEPRIAKYPLSFEFVDQGGTISLNIEYAIDLFDRDRIERMAGHFDRLTRAVTAHPDTPVARLDLFDDTERALLIGKSEKIDLPERATVPTMFGQWVARQPEAPAVACNGSRLTYAELDRRARAVARGLTARGIGRDDVVAVLLDRSEVLAVAFLGVLMAGAVYLPLDPTYPVERLDLMLADSAARAVIGDVGHADRLATDGIERLDIAALNTLGTILVAVQVVPEANDPAYLIYTSGSTGRPKGVLLEHRGAANLALAQRHWLGIAPADRIVQFAPSSFDASVWEMFMALLNGACLVVADAEQVCDPLAFAACLADERVTVATLPPTYLGALDDAALDPLRLLVTAGEAPDAARAIRLTERMTVVNAYGPTETTICASWHQVDPSRDADRPIPIGRAIANMSMIVLDRFGNLAPIGVAGEIHVGGVGLARGYLDRPDLTRAAFVGHPFAPGERLYRTGDRGVVEPDGAVRFAGRRDRQVKLRGYRIEIPEIERAIARLPGVAEALVSVRAGTAGEALVAFVVPDGGVSVAALEQALARSLPAHMLPARWVMRDALPLLPNGKVDHAALPDDPTPVVTAPQFDDPREAVVAAAWRTVLGRDGFGRHDRFFSVGGDSIRAIQAVGLLRGAGHTIDVRAFLTAPTVAGIAALLDDAPVSAPVSARVDLADVEAAFGNA